MEAKRKKWTPKEEITDSLLKFREKRKWQLALRRYVLEKNISQAYAPYFGLDIESFRKWFELQFKDGLNWDNFGTAWQFEHIVPVAYFDFSDKEDLLLCWNFINIRVERLEANRARGNRVDIISVKPYFESLYEKTGYFLCARMIDKINRIQVSGIDPMPEMENFIIEQKDQLEKIAGLSQDEFTRLNQGTSLQDILLEREILRRFG